MRSELRDTLKKVLTRAALSEHQKCSFCEVPIRGSRFLAMPHTEDCPYAVVKRYMNEGLMESARV